MNPLRVSVAPRFRAGFFEEACIAGYWCWWFYRDPGVEQGDAVVFVMDRKIVAEATIAHVVRRGKKTIITWKDFRDLRGEEEGFKPNLYGGYRQVGGLHAEA